MTTQLSRRVLGLRFQLGVGAFATGADTLDVSGLRASASISVPGGISLTTLEMRVFGLPLDVMNRLTILGPLTLIGVDANKITVTADGSTVFQGTIMQCWVDANSSPDVSLIVMASTGGLDNKKPVNPSTYKGSVSAESIIRDMASRLSTPMPVTNNGVTAQITNGYFAGVLFDQMHQVAQQGMFSLAFDNEEIAIWPYGYARQGSADATTEVSAATGMIGYPTHTESGISVQTLYNPELAVGDAINVKSILTTPTLNGSTPNDVSGVWTIYGMTHDLESETPNGKWFTAIDCYLYKRPQ